MIADGQYFYLFVASIVTINVLPQENYSLHLKERLHCFCKLKIMNHQILVWIIRLLIVLDNNKGI